MSYLINDKMSIILGQKDKLFKSLWGRKPSILVLSDDYYNILKKEVESFQTDVIDVGKEYYKGRLILKTPVQGIINYY